MRAPFALSQAILEVGQGVVVRHAGIAGVLRQAPGLLWCRVKGDLVAADQATVSLSVSMTRLCL